ncbi:deoxyribonuclease IV [Candidatus Acetothermia bacterium]|nr:deoxyribonuclease IV [Candidatus Acetothermia bacterium]MBI3660447.1 deoxyribonuclease IV [Candidatus Acetothermia bacterium]
MILGCHLSIAGGADKAIDLAEQLDNNALQIFSHNARSWKMGSLKDGEAERFIERRKNSSIEYVVIHTIYLINLGSPDSKIFPLSVKALQDEVKRAGELGIEHVNTHIGAHMSSGEAAGLKRVAQALEEVFASDEAGSAPDVKVLLEICSGGGTELGWRFEEFSVILDNLKAKSAKRVGVCLDTCHALCAGYAVHTAEGLDKTVKELDKMVGLDKLDLIHLNDSKHPLGSRKDRHEHIGKGFIGLDGFKRIVNHPALRDKPFILETPKDDDSSDPMNLAQARKLREL